MFQVEHFIPNAMLVIQILGYPQVKLRGLPVCTPLRERQSGRCLQEAERPLCADYRHSRAIRPAQKRPRGMGPIIVIAGRLRPS
jgi:hypothetical protein